MEYAIKYNPEVIKLAEDEGVIDAPIGRDKKDRKKMAVVADGKTTVLPLPAGGLMTQKPYEEVCSEMEVLHAALANTGADEKAFMSLSFMALTVVPHLKITPRGLFDGDAFCDVDIRC